MRWRWEKCWLLTQAHSVAKRKWNPGLSLTSSTSWGTRWWCRCRSSWKSSHSPSRPSLWKRSAISTISGSISILAFLIRVIQMEQGTEEKYKECEKAPNHVLNIIDSKGPRLLDTSISTDENHFDGVCPSRGRLGRIQNVRGINQLRTVQWHNLLISRWWLTLTYFDLSEC